LKTVVTAAGIILESGRPPRLAATTIKIIEGVYKLVRKKEAAQKKRLASKVRSSVPAKG